MFKKFMFLVPLVMLVGANNARATILASTDYVNRQINAATSSLQNQINASANKINETTKSLTHRIGENYQGGIVFWVDESGQHGLIAAKLDASEGVQWSTSDYSDELINAVGNGIGAGYSNTQLSIAEQTFETQNGKFAALVAASLSVAKDGETICEVSSNAECYGGWYLPSIYELNLMFTNLQSQGLGNCAAENYWSSTENGEKAWLENLGTGKQEAYDKEAIARVRPIRAF